MIIRNGQTYDDNAEDGDQLDLFDIIQPDEYTDEERDLMEELL
jgi:hypothetical protein